MSLVLVLVLLALAASSGLVRSQQQPEPVEVFQEGDAVGVPNEVKLLFSQ